LEFARFKPDEALELRAKQFQSENFLEKGSFERLLRRYLAKLDEENTGVQVQRQVIKGARSFFDYYDLGLQVKRKDWPTGSGATEVRAIRKSEIRQLLAVSDLYERALILTLKDTGLNVADLANIRIKNLGGDVHYPSTWRERLDESQVPISVIERRVKTGQGYHTFLGPESSSTLMVYFEHREKGTEYMYKVGGLPPEPLSLESHIFRLKARMTPVDAHGLTNIVCYVMRKAKMKGLSARSFRKYFQTTLENPELGINPNWIRRMMGHKVQRDAPGHYSDPLTLNPDSLEEAYRRAIPYLRVERRVGEDRLKAMEERLESYESENEQLKAVLEMILEQQKQINKLRRT